MTRLTLHPSSLALLCAFLALGALTLPLPGAWGLTFGLLAGIAATWLVERAYAPPGYEAPTPGDLFTIELRPLRR